MPFLIAQVVKLVDTLDLGSSAVRCVGSSPSLGKLSRAIFSSAFLCLYKNTNYFKKTRCLSFRSAAKSATAARSLLIASRSLKVTVSAAF